VSLATSELKTEVVAFKRRRILEVAAHLFYERGYEGTKLDDISEMLQVTKPYLYSYFRNKAEILFEICQTGIRLSLAELDAALALDAPPDRRLREAVERVAHVVIDKRESVVVYAREEKNLDADDSARIREMRHAFDRQISELLRAGVEAGLFEVEDYSVAATTIGGIVSWLPNWYVPAGRLSADEVVGITVRLVERMLQGDTK
jgi:AcrR family transcriptional regulator